MTFIVAITRLAPAAALEATRGAEASALSPLVGVGVYELRVALGGALPLVLARNSEAEHARAVLSALHARGYGAVACDDATISDSARWFAPREFSFESQALIGSSNQVPRAELPWAALSYIIVATRLSSESTTVETKEKKFSLGRAALSGGLIMNKKVTKTEHRSHDDREPIVYLLQSGGEPWLLAGSHLRYGGLGERLGAAAHENFRTLLSLLREHAPAAVFDERLMKQNRAASKLIAAGTAGTVQTSNFAEIDLAVQLLALAHAQGQV